MPVFGVFGDQSVDEILRISRAAGLAGAQLHGPYRPRGRGAGSAPTGCSVWRVVRIAGPDDLGRAARGGARTRMPCWSSPGCRTRPGEPACRSTSTLAREARARLAGARMVLAGGLTPETVGGAPWPSFDRTSWM